MAIAPTNDRDFFLNRIIETPVALTASATITLDGSLGNHYTLTPTSDTTINATNRQAGRSLSIEITTSGTTSYNITFGTNFKSAGVLATGTVTAKIFIVYFWDDGTSIIETVRSGPDGAGAPTGTFVNLQASTPGSAQTGHSNITGTLISGGQVIGTAPGTGSDISTVSTISRSVAGECVVATIANTHGISTGDTAGLSFTFDTNLTATAIIRAVVENSVGALTGIGFSTYNSGCTERIRMRGDGRFGVGIHSPFYSGHFAGQPGATIGGVIIEQDSADTVGPVQYFWKGRGTTDTPVQPTTGDTLGSISFAGYGSGGGTSTTLDSRTWITGAQIKAVSTGTIAATRVAAYLSFLTGTDAAPTVLTEAMRIDKVQRVYLGDTFTGGGSNLNILVAAAAGSATATVTATDAGGTSQIVINNAVIESFGSTVAGTIDGINKASLQVVGNLASAGALLIRTSPTTTDPMLFATNGAERMRITSGGNVGIGMTPARVLDVTGTFGATGAATLGSTLTVAGAVTVNVAGNTVPQAWNATSVGTGYLFAQVINTGGTTQIGADSSVGGTFTGSLAYASIFGANGTNSTQFITSAAVRMTILSGGNVGIGTTAPNHTLDVNGKWGARESVLTLANGANQDVVITTSFVNIIGPTGAFSIGGIAGGTAGQIVTFFSAVGFTMTVNYNDGGSTAGNRILHFSGANVACGGTTYAWFSVVYSTNTGRWLLFAHS